MKTNILRNCIVALIIITITSCSKKDDPESTPPPNNNNPSTDSISPVITLNGSAHMTISLNSSWTDPGATANDAHDGSVNVSSNTSSSNPNVNLTGAYTIVYTAADSTGNTDSTFRIVTVVNDAAVLFEGTYNVFDTVLGISFYYTQIITADNMLNNRIHFSLFSDYANNTAIYANKLTNGSLDLPNQLASNIGTGVGPCDIATHAFQSTSYTQNSNGFTMHYTDAITAPSSCLSTVSGKATYVKQ